MQEEALKLAQEKENQRRTQSQIDKNIRKLKKQENDSLKLTEKSEKTEKIPKMKIRIVVV